MSFTQAPSIQHQKLVLCQDKPHLQTLSPTLGPVLFPLREINSNPKNGWERKHTAYPTSHSVPGPYLQSYIALPNKMYYY